MRTFPINSWTLGSLFLLGIVLCPILALGVKSLSSGSGHLSLLDPYLFTVFRNTFLLASCVGALSGVLGVSLAWFTSMCRFPGRQLFQVALMLPLAIPPYVLAFVSIGVLDYSGPVATWMRTEWGLGLLSIRSFGGLVLILSLSLYPYVYLLLRHAFISQGARAFEVAQSLGKNMSTIFFKVSLPMAKPWILAGLLLVLMEVFADFGAVSVFNYDTFTTAIYKAWFGFFSLGDAARLSAVLLLLALGLLLADRFLRGTERFSAAGREQALVSRQVLQGWKGWAVSAYCSLVLLLAFVLPVLQLMSWTLGDSLSVVGYGQAFRSSLILGGLGSMLVVGAALLLVLTERYFPGLWMGTVSRLASIGYAIPGTVLAVGLYIPISRLGTGHLWAALSLMLLAYIVRFMAVAQHGLRAAMARIRPAIDESARSMGCSFGRLATRIHLPLLRGGVLSALLLVFVDVLKEMPITLMTRPFGWDSLAVKVFEFSSEGAWEQAAFPALAIVIIGLIPVILLSRFSEYGFYG